MHLPHFSPPTPVLRPHEPLRWRTLLAGVLALLALTAFIGGLAAAATWGFVRLVTAALA